MTKEDYGDWDHILANIPSNPFDSPDSTNAFEPAFGDWRPSSSDEANSSPPALQLPDSNGEPPVKGNQNWQSNEVAKRRQVLLVATIGVIGSIFAAIGFWGFVSYMNRPSSKEATLAAATPPTTNPPLSAEESQEVDPSTPSKETTEPSKEASLPDSVAPSAPDGSSTDSNTTTLDADGQTPIVLPSNPNGPGETANDPSTVMPAPGTNVGNDSEKSPGSTGSSLTDFLKSPPNKAASEEEVSEAEKIASEKLPELFGPNGIGRNILNPQNMLADGGFGKQGNINDLDLENFVEPADILAYPDPKPLPNWSEKASAIQVVRWKAQELTLPKCIDLFSRMTGVGITIDWPMLRSAGISESLSFSYDSSDKTLEQIFTEILAQENLALEVNANSFPIVRPSPKLLGTSKESVWKLEGIVETGEEQRFAERLIELWEAGPVCTARDGTLVWSEQASLIDKASVWTSIQLLARSLEKPAFKWPESTPTPLLLFDPNDWKKSHSILERKIPEDFIQPELRSSSELMMTAASASKMTLLIDWQSVWTHGFAPSETGVTLYGNRTFPQIARRFVDTYSMDFVVIGENTLIATIPESRKVQCCVVPIRITGDDGVNTVKRYLYQLAPQSPTGQSRFRVTAVPGCKEWYWARVTYPTVDQLDDSELISAFGW